jgi:hypothetical protein
MESRKSESRHLYNYPGNDGVDHGDAKDAAALELAEETSKGRKEIVHGGTCDRGAGNSA